MATEEVAWPGAMAISKDERAFFIQFGARISNFRRQLSMTQTQLADDLGVSQQAVNAYEAGTPVCRFRCCLSSPPRSSSPSKS